MSRTTAILVLLIPTVLVGVVLYFVIGGRPPAVAGEDYASRSEIRDLRDRIEALESKLAASRRGAPMEVLGPREKRGSGEEAASLPDYQMESRISRIEKALEQMSLSGGEPTEELMAALAEFVAPKEKVKAILDEVREEERQAEKERQRQETADEIRKRLEEAADRLQLSDAEIGAMTDILTDESLARRELFEDGRGPRGGFDNMREKMTEIRETRDEALAQILQPWQIEEYEQIEREQRRGWFGGGRMGPGGGDRRGGDRRGGGDRPQRDSQ